MLELYEWCHNSTGKVILSEDKISCGLNGKNAKIIRENNGKNGEPWHHPPLHPPLNDDMAIAGHHRNIAASDNVSPAVTVHVHATTTVQAPVTPVRS